jgi:hypothetical protein
MFPRCFLDVSSMFPRRFLDVFSMSSRCLSRFVVVEFLKSSALSKRQERHQNLWVSDPSRDGNAGKNVSARCVTTVLVCWLYGTCTVLVWCLYCACMVLVWCLYGACMVLVLCLYGGCIVLVWCLYGACMVFVWWLYNGCTVVVLVVVLAVPVQLSKGRPGSLLGCRRATIIFHVLIECLTDSTIRSILTVAMCRCFSMFFNVFQCFSMFFNVFRCFSMFFNVFQCFSMFFDCSFFSLFLGQM